MASRLLALSIAAAVALGVTGSANGYVGDRQNGDVFDVASGAWDTTDTYGVNGKKRTCTLTRGAKCVGAKLQDAAPVHRKKAKRGNSTPKCAPNCQGANLSDANLTDANLTGANLSLANLTDAAIGEANLSGAILFAANLDGVTWGNTTCPDGTVTSTGCPT